MELASKLEGIEFNQNKTQQTNKLHWKRNLSVDLIVIDLTTQLQVVVDEKDCFNLQEHVPHFFKRTSKFCRPRNLSFVDSS